jgi:hypothetical protein
MIMIMYWLVLAIIDHDYDHDYDHDHDREGHEGHIEPKPLIFKVRPVL